jgi:hypothetical protein
VPTRSLDDKISAHPNNVSPAEARERWEKGALRFQQSYPEAANSAWPKPRSDQPPPSGLNCWNCGKRGHYSSACPNEWVIPREVVLASISWDFELYQAGLEMEGDDVEKVRSDLIASQFLALTR